MYYYKPDEDAYYITTTKNGSTLLHEIAETDNRLKPIDLHSCLASAHKNDSVIRIPFRNPKPRFISGLSVNLFNNTNGRFAVDLQGATATFTLSVHYNNFVNFFKNSINNLNSFAPGKIISPPYHLFDSHLDHWLCIPLLLILCDYKVELIPMHDFTNHLTERFPDCASIVKARERKNSFDVVNGELLPLWEAYKHVMIDTSTYSYSWEEWMSPELEIFNVLSSNYDKDTVKSTFEKLWNQQIYFNEPFSPRCNNMYNFLSVIRQIQQPIPTLTHFFNNYQSIYKSIDLFRNNQIG